jgi:hypothetical protein
VGAALGAESFPDIHEEHQDPIVGEPGAVLDIDAGGELDVLRMCDKNVTNQGEFTLASASGRRELPLSDESILVTDLAGLLEVRSSDVIEKLGVLDHHVKSTDSVNAELAVKVGRRHGVDFIRDESSNECEARRGGEPSPSTLLANSHKSYYQFRNGQYVRAGDWIRDSKLGLGRILKLHTDPGEPDRHQVWFAGNTEGGIVVDRHVLGKSTLGIIDHSMIPDDLRSAAPVISK